MNDLESQLATAQELVSLGREHGFELDTVCYDWAFLSGDRFLCMWRRNEVVHYNLQGDVGELPMQYEESATAFRGAWTEAGTVEDIGQAFDLLKAWLLDRKEVDDLPPRSVRRCGI